MQRSQTNISNVSFPHLPPTGPSEGKDHRLSCVIYRQLPDQQRRSHLVFCRGEEVMEENWEAQRKVSMLFNSNTDMSHFPRPTIDHTARILQGQIFSSWMAWNSKSTMVKDEMWRSRWGEKTSKTPWWVVNKSDWLGVQPARTILDRESICLHLLQYSFTDRLVMPLCKRFQ